MALLTLKLQCEQVYKGGGAKYCEVDEDGEPLYNRGMSIFIDKFTIKRNKITSLPRSIMLTIDNND